MGISVREVWALKEFQAFQLVAGESGLDNQIEKVGILDYEFALQNDREPRKWGFRKHDFVLSSLLFAKDRPELLLPMVKELNRDRVSALAIKNVCYAELPSEVISYANEHRLPIFMFGRDDAYFEDIVMTLKTKIQERSSLEQMEHQISLFLNGELDAKSQRELNRKILTERTESYRLLYCHIVDKEEKIRDYQKYYVLKTGSEERKNVFYYKGGCFVVVYRPDRGENEKSFLKYREYLQSILRMPVNDYWIGLGEVHEDPEEDLQYALKESLCAQMYASLFDRQRVWFSQMGIYRVLLPCYQQHWFRKFSIQIIQKILDFDREYDGSLYKTVEYYVRNHANIVEVAERMHLHKNTVRYRINKVKEILGMEESDSFEVQITVAFLVDELNQWFS